MGTAVMHPAPDWVKPSFVNFISSQKELSIMCHVMKLWNKWKLVASHNKGRNCLAN